MTPQESVARWQVDKQRLEAIGIHLPGVRRYITPGEKANNRGIAMDAAGTLVTDPNSAVPLMLTTGAAALPVIVMPVPPVTDVTVPSAPLLIAVTRPLASTVTLALA